MTSKTCFKCQQDKPLDEFYAHPAMADGRLGKCKSCTKTDVSRNRLENLDRIRAYDRERAKNPERARNAREISARWRAEDRRRASAHSKVAAAIRAGKLQRMPCERCLRKDSVGHHESYDRPLDVTWLCQPCHKERHKEMAMSGIDP